MRRRGLCCWSLSVRLSVCRSDVFVCCIQTVKDIVKLLSQPNLFFIYYKVSYIKYRNIHKQRTAQATWKVQKARTVQLAP